MLQSHVPALGVEEGSSGRKDLEGGGAGNKPGHGRALCGPHWFTGIRRGFIPSPAAMPNAPVRSWSVWGSCGVLELHLRWDPGSALAQGARCAVLPLQPQRFVPPQHKSWKMNGQKDVPAPCHQLRFTSSWLGEVSGSCQSLGCWGLARAPSGGWCCPGDWSCLRGWSRWDTADAIVGCLSVRLSQFPRWAGGPGASHVCARRPGRFSEAPGTGAAGGRSSSAGGRQGLGVGLCRARIQSPASLGELPGPSTPERRGCRPPVSLCPRGCVQSGAGQEPSPAAVGAGAWGPGVRAGGWAGGSPAVIGGDRIGLSVPPCRNLPLCCGTPELTESSGSRSRVLLEQGISPTLSLWDNPWRRDTHVQWGQPRPDFQGPTSPHPPHPRTATICPWGTLSPTHFWCWVPSQPFPSRGPSGRGTELCCRRADVYAAG